MPSKEEIWKALLASFPEPDDTDAYVPALYYSQMAESLQTLAKVYADAFSDAVYRIRKENLTSEVYEIVEHFRETRKVDVRPSPRRPPGHLRLTRASGFQNRPKHSWSIRNFLAVRGCGR